MMMSSENCQEILRYIASGVVITDESGKVKYLNAMAEHLTGWTSQEAFDLPIDQIVRFFDEMTCEPLEDSLVS